VQPVIKPAPTAKDTNILQGSSSSNISPPSKRDDEVLYASLPEHASITGVLSRKFTPTRPRAERDESNGAGLTPAIPSSSKHITILDESPRLPKKPKQGGGGNTDSGPSLLSRMSNGSRDSASTAGERKGGTQTGNSVSKLPEHEKREELSIRGAASRTMEGAPSVFTLLDRIQDGDSPITEDDRARKRKKRGRAQR